MTRLIPMYAFQHIRPIWIVARLASDGFESSVRILMDLTAIAMGLVANGSQFLIIQID
ncbi:hypothetical protein JJD41_16985 [Oxynema sp. CENA135]|uniref:hypothetical protein n=1 Tax=Oxynema sp. CENA135 TaxID=984206 RepID=UPI001A49DA4C|nr:hypothetical protein [Oxynema sp. CENA135]MBK4731547.1 hypothetical protein [Oxynema sp. CENA135]